MGYLGATLTQVFTRAGGTDVSLRDVTIAQIGKGATECGCLHEPEAHGEFWDFEKVSWVESCLGRRRLTFACSRRPCDGCARVCVAGCRWKSQNRKNVYLSPYVEELLNSKVIKSFVPELRSRKCLRVSRFLCYIYMLYMNILMNIICPFHHIHIWLWYHYEQLLKKIKNGGYTFGIGDSLK